MGFKTMPTLSAHQSQKLSSHATKAIQANSFSDSISIAFQHSARSVAQWDTETITILHYGNLTLELPWSQQRALSS